MKTIPLATIVATLFLYACRREADEIQRSAPTQTNQSVSIGELTRFLSSTTGATPDKIVYKATDTLFIIDKDQLISKAEAEKYYKANQGARTEQWRGFYLVADAYVVNMKVFIQADVPADWITATRNAIPQWNSVYGTKIHFTEVLSSNTADITIRTDYAANAYWIALGEYPFYSGQPGSKLTINTYYNFITASVKLNTIIHELGHTIGLFHTNETAGFFIPGTPAYDPNSVMHSVAHAWTGFTSGDVKAVQTLYPAGNWVQFPGSAFDIGVGPEGSVYVIGQDATSGGYGIYRGSYWGVWTKLSGGAVRIAVASQGVPWIVNNRGYIYRLNGNSWQQLPGAAYDIGAGADGSVYVIGRGATSGGYGIHRWNGSSWTQLPGGAVRIAVDAQGMPWIVDNLGRIYRLNGNSWQQIPGAASDIGVGADGSVYAIGWDATPGGYGIYRWNGVSWSQRSGVGAIAVSVGPQGQPWVVNSFGNIFYGPQ